MGAHPQVGALGEELQGAILGAVHDGAGDGGYARHHHFGQLRQQRLQPPQAQYVLFGFLRS